MTRRTRAGIFLGAIAAAGAVGIAASGDAWLRVLIAPAWRTGGLASGSMSSPNLIVVVATVFVGAFAIGFFGWALIQPNSRLNSTRARTLATNLVLLYALVALELRFYPSIASTLFEAVGGQGGVGSSYPLVLAMRLIPGALLLLTLATVATILVLRHRPQLTSGAILAVWMLHVVCLVGSVAWYFSPAGPGNFR